MRKLLFSLLSLGGFFSAFTQTTLVSRLEATNFDDRKIMAEMLFTTTTFVADARLNSDAPHTFSLSAGPNLARYIDDEIRISFMPGLVFDHLENQYFYSGALIFRAEEIQRVETFVYAKILKSFNQPKRARVVAEGELLYSFIDKGEKFKLKSGPFLFFEQEKRLVNLTSPRTEAMEYDDLFLVAGKFIVESHKTLKNFSFTGFAGYEHRVSIIKPPGYVLDYHITNKFVFSLGVIHKF